LDIALGFARRGDQVVATMRRPSESALQALTGVDIRALDVTRPESIATAVRGTLERYGRIDALINNAGIGVVSALETLDGAMLREVFETNVFGAIAVTQAVLPGMRAQGAGRIVFVSAIGALLNTAYLGAYCASKHALDCVAATWDVELRPFGIRVSSVLPSAFNTGMAGNMRLATSDDSAYGEAEARYFAGLKARMEGGPKDLAPVVDAVIEAVTSEDPKPRYLVAPHLKEVLGPVVDNLERLHQREVALTPSGGGNAPRP
jgi:NAD(P)-dependent dehydrogenase (short-subunit alcohol dehydrogenase family)